MTRAAIANPRCFRRKQDTTAKHSGQPREPKQQRKTTPTIAVVPPPSIQQTMAQQVQGRGNTGVGLDTGETADDDGSPAVSFPALGDGVAAASSSLPPSAGEWVKHPVEAENGSNCSSRSTDAPSSRGSERDGCVMIFDSPADVGPSTGDRLAAEEPTQDGEVATPRTSKANACLSCPPI